MVVLMLCERGKTDEAIGHLKSVVEINQQEPGCSRWAMYRDVDDPDVIVIVERWDSRATYELQLEQPHIHHLIENISPLFAGLPRISITEPMAVGDERWVRFSPNRAHRSADRSDDTLG